jgi:hypothetical protein
MQTQRPIYLLLVFLVLLTSTASSSRKVYTTASSFKTALGAAVPGDTIELADGAYDISANSLTKSGTAEMPVVIRAQNRGKAELKGKSSFACKGIAFVVFEGFLFTSDVSTVIKTESCNNIRITRNTFRLSETTSSKWILIGGTYNIATANSHHNRIDHNLFENKKQLGNYITIDGSPASLGSPEASRYDRIDHNHFRTIGPRAVNEMETIRIGQSEICRSSSFTLVEHNLFEECDGDPEIVSVKTKHSIVRYNTFRRSQGTVCLRSSDSSVVEGNYFFGEGKSGTGGVRLYGVGHRIINNYFNGLTGDTWDAAVTITNGDAEPTGSTTSHWRPQRITVAFNTFAGNANNFQFGFTNNGSYFKPPQDLTIANNIVVGTQNQFVKVITQPTGLLVSGNVMYPSAAASIGIAAADTQVRNIDPKLVMADSVWRISVGSPAIDAATSAAPFVQQDIMGQTRGALRDVGAQEYTVGERINRPLRPEDVGPNGPDSVTVITAVRRSTSSGTDPAEFALLQIYPNPFNPSTMIYFSIAPDPASGGNGTQNGMHTTLTVFNILGQSVATLFDGPAAAGEYRIPFNASHLGSGVYFARLVRGGHMHIKGMVVQR